MPREFFRADRVSDAIQRILAKSIQQEVRDPRVGLVNVNSVTVTRDLAYAKAYITFVGIDDEAECVAGAKILNNAAGYLRTILSKELNMRSTPKLQFIYDRTSVKGQELSQLIAKARASDTEKAEERGGLDDGAASNELGDTDEFEQKG